MAEKRKDDKGRVLKTGESQRKDGTYMYRYTDQSGKRYTLYAKTLKELREKEDNVTTRKTLGMQSAPSQMTVRELVQRFSKTCVHVKESTKHVYYRQEKMICDTHIANEKITKVTSSDLKLWMISLAENGYAQSTVYQAASFLRRAFDMAVEDQLVFRNPFLFKMNFAKGTKRKKRTSLTEAQQKELLSFLQSEKRIAYLYDNVVVLIGTGLRIGEFTGLTINDLDFEAKTINVNKQLSQFGRNAPAIVDVKSESGNRIIPMSPVVEEALQRMVKRQKRYKMVPIVDGYTGFITLDSRGNITGSHKINRTLERWVEKYNKEHKTKLPHITAHIFRHTFCTNMVHAGMDPSSVQYLMGHATPTTTLDVYTHCNFDSAQKAAKEIFAKQKMA